MNIDSLENALENIDLSNWDMYMSDIGAPSPTDFAQTLISGKTDITGIFDIAQNLLYESAGEHVPVFVTLLSVSALCAFTKAVKSTNLAGASKAAQLSFLLIAALPVCSLAKEQLFVISDALGRACSLCISLLPTLGAIFTAMGANVSSGVSSPLVLLCTQAAGYFSVNILPALVSVMCAMAIVSSMSYDKRADGLFMFINSFAVFFLTGTLSLFSASACVAIGGASSADSVSMRAAKYAVDNYVPIVGGLFADSFEILRACLGGLKNTIGITASFYIALICLPSLLSCALSSLTLKAVSALSSLMGSDVIGKLCERMSKAFTLLLAGQLTCLLALLVCVCALLSVGAGI